jgi:hypothetical protein
MLAERRMLNAVVQLKCRFWGRRHSSNEMSALGNTTLSPFVVEEMSFLGQTTFKELNVSSRAERHLRLCSFAAVVTSD